MTTTTTGRKSAVTQASEERVALNLDKVEREGKPQDFSVVLGGKHFVLLDAMEMDWQDLIAAQVAFMNGNPAPAVESIVAEKDREAFFANKLPSYKLQALFKAYNEHYGINPQMEESGPIVVAIPGSN
jgi:hypothetical protein